MKRTGLYLIPSFIIVILSSCSNDSAEKETGRSTATTTATVNNTAVTVPSAAKEKRSDVTAQRLKGKVEVLSESVFFGRRNKQKPHYKTCF